MRRFCLLVCGPSVSPTSKWASWGQVEPVSLYWIPRAEHGVWPRYILSQIFANDLAVSEWVHPYSQIREMWTTSSLDEEVGKKAPRNSPGGGAGPPKPRRNVGSRGANVGSHRSQVCVSNERDHLVKIRKDRSGLKSQGHNMHSGWGKELEPDRDGEGLTEVPGKTHGVLSETPGAGSFRKGCVG